MLATVVITGLGLLLASIAYYDFRWMIIPDKLTAGVLFLGIGYRMLTSREAVQHALLFAFIVFALFWLVRAAYQRARDVPGIGFGDVKFAGAAAIWISPLTFPIYLLVATSSALAYLLATSLSGASLTRRIPFGPFLALSLFAAVLAERHLDSIFPGTLP